MIKACGRLSASCFIILGFSETPMGACDIIYSERVTVS